MTVEGVSYTGSETTVTKNASDNTSIDQVDFLTLLTTQLEYQDPTNPVDNSEMINQMTNYAMLDEDVAQNTNLETIINQLDALSSLSTSTLIGQEVLADGGVITVKDGTASGVTVDLKDDAAALGLNIYDSSGALVDTVYFSDVEAGQYNISGEELTAQGKLNVDGTYTALAFAVDENDAAVAAYIKSVGTITAVDSSDSGTTNLTLDDGREVSMADVTFIS
ncbi:flagellar hook assembly protein FlgD [Maridesulfovibrio zosterae]|uniref:flagellar hook assembly protein FlgD n=1 Tax=Maridesulfovibrio zosterae TaxID=82171 RepID=UPI000426D5BA|nr:flagellar hook capping FlgD N-terminal domain-containing protein [Maridesulfovibrio zosterae]